MDGQERRDHWERLYDAKREDEVSWFQAEPAASLSLVARASVPLSAPIIDVGGGASRLVDHLLRVGYADLTVLDIAAAALAQPRKRLGRRAAEIDWLTADVTRWQPPRAFALWHDRAVFHFLTEAEDREAYCTVLRRAVAPGGAVIIGTFAADGPERCSGLPVVRYAPEALAAELGNGFDLVETAADEHKTPAGGTQRFQFSRFQVRRVPD